MKKEYVTCPVCGKNYLGVPSKANPDVLIPRLHFMQSAPVTNNLGIMIAKYPGKKVYCPGCFQEGILPGEKNDNK